MDKGITKQQAALLIETGAFEALIETSHSRLFKRFKSCNCYEDCVAIWEELNGLRSLNQSLIATMGGSENGVKH